MNGSWRDFRARKSGQFQMEAEITLGCIDYCYLCSPMYTREKRNGSDSRFKGNESFFSVLEIKALSFLFISQKMFQLSLSSVVKECKIRTFNANIILAWTGIYIHVYICSRIDQGSSIF